MNPASEIYMPREFMNRTEKYERGLALTNRIYELQTTHGWTEQETKLAFAVLDDNLPIALHNIGEHIHLNILTSEYCLLMLRITTSFPASLHASRRRYSIEEIRSPHRNAGYFRVLPTD